MTHFSYSALRRFSGPALRSWLPAQTRSVAVPGALVLGALSLFVSAVDAHYFLCDDAFISFRYVRNLLAGEGLVFNHGERVEGYTNFLWVLELAGLQWLTGLPLEHIAPALSLLLTAATIALTGWLAFHSPLGRHRQWIAALALIFLVTERSFAVWATSGLETRQFTFLLLSALALLSHGAGRHRRWIGSMLLGLSEWARPEGLLLGGLAIAGVWGLHAWERRRTPRLALIAQTALPFAVLVAGHFLWRYAYYGELLPNTYYAKHVRAWWDMGLRYLGAAAIESGMYLTLPLTGLALWLRARRARLGFLGLAALLIAAHSAYLAHIGGDHFEYRPLDFYWPVLALGTAEALVCLGERLVDRGALASACALCCGVWVHARAIELAHFDQAHRIEGRSETRGLVIETEADRAPVAYAPLAWPLLPVYHGLLKELASHAVGLRHQEHRNFWQQQRRWYGPYAAYDRGQLLPAGAVAEISTVGVVPYSLPSLTVIDRLGLTDREVARNPVAHANAERQMAHDRRPPAGYIASRGVNMTIHPFESSLRKALAAGDHVLVLGPHAFLPFDSSRPGWVRRAFAHQPLWSKRLGIRGRDRVLAAGVPYVERARIATFERGRDGFDPEKASIRQPVRGPQGAQQPIRGIVGRRLINTFAADQGDRATGSWKSRPFVPKPNDALVFMVGGGTDRGVGVALRNGEHTVRVWRGDRSERLGLVFFDLNPWVGRSLHLRIFDDSAGPWGHVLADHFLLVRPARGREPAGRFNFRRRAG